MSDRAGQQSPTLDPRREPPDKQKLVSIVLLPGVLFAALVIWLIASTLEEAAQIATIVGGVGTLLLSFLGAIGGAWWFFRRQPFIPKVNIEQEVSVFPGPRETYLLQIFARLENMSELPVTIKAWRIWVCPLDPLPYSVEEVLLSKNACVDTVLPWESCTGGRIEKECFDEIRMRAGEVQEIIASVLVGRDSRTVRIHSFFPHPKLNLTSGEDRGWTRYSIVTLKGEVDEREPEGGSGKSSLETLRGELPGAH